MYKTALGAPPFDAGRADEKYFNLVIKLVMPVLFLLILQVSSPAAVRSEPDKSCPREDYLALENGTGAILLQNYDYFAVGQGRPRFGHRRCDNRF